MATEAPRRAAREVLAASLARRLAAAVLAALLSAGAAAAQEGPDALKLYLDGKYEEARRACLDEIAARPDGLESYVVLSWSLVSLERWADAENYAKKGLAIRRDPRLVEVLGEASFYLGKNDAALRGFQEYTTAVPEGGRAGSAFYYMGEIYLRQARYAHADIAFSTAVQYSPGNARWWTRLGWAREKASDFDHAVLAYKKALSISPRLQDALDGVDRCTAVLR
jgi:tetratricopeptide (TPR) repeat protein